MWLIISLTTKVFSDLTLSAIQPRGDYSPKIRLRGGGWVNTARFLKPWPYFRPYPVQKVWNRGRSSNSRCLFGLYAFNRWTTSPMKNIKNIRTPYYFMPKWFPFHTKVAPKPYPLAPDMAYMALHDVSWCPVSLPPSSPPGIRLRWKVLCKIY